MRKTSSVSWMLLCAFGMSTGIAGGGLTVTDLKCEYQRRPLGIHAARPRLSWELQSDRRGDLQSAYRILVASSLERLQRDEGDFWDSGKVESSQSVHIPYHGKSMESRTICYWKVRAWDKALKPSGWSEPSTWEMGLLSADVWQAKWINDGKANPQKDEDFYREDPAPLFRREFTLPKNILRARLYISGLGYYEASLNGVRVGDHVLDPGWTRYSERALYSTYDVTRWLRQGPNCIGVTLGNGWYNPLPLRLWGHMNLREHLPVERPRFIAHLDVLFTDGMRQSIVSDAHWKFTEGPLRFNNIYLGEIYDARKELPGWDRPGFDDSLWRHPAVAAEPIGPLHSQSQPPIRVTRTLPAVNLTEPRPGVFIFDLGRNFAGWVVLKFSAPVGTRVSLRYGELLNADGTLNPMTSVCGQIKGTRKTAKGREESVGGPGAPLVAWQCDTYIARGRDVETYTPRFTFHAFRYVEVTGFPGRPSRNAVTGLRLNSDVERAGEFSCSNEQINRIQEMCDWTFLSNLFSVHSDCPHRERFGYRGDLAVTSEAFMMNYDMATFYAKAVRDWHDSALPDGMLTDTAPFAGIQYCGPAWAMAHPLVLRQLHRYYGDRQLMEEQYQTARRWLDLVAGTIPDGIVKDGLSDHEGLAPAPATAMVTPLLAGCVRNLSEMAVILKHPEDAAKYGRLADRIQNAYMEKFLDKANGRVGPGTQASQAFALYESLVPAEHRPAAMQALLDDICRSHQKHLSTGIFGTKFMLDVLSREGHSDTAYNIVNQRTFPGWGYMLDSGATTLWEHWQGSDNTFSHNHPMFSSVSQWFYQWLGGIQPDADAVGFDRVIIRPQFVKDLQWVKCSFKSVRGKIVSNWQRDGDLLKMNVEIPVGASAIVYLPATSPSEIKMNGNVLSQSHDARYLRFERNQLLYLIGSGDYAFEIATSK